MREAWQIAAPRFDGGDLKRVSQPDRFEHSNGVMPAAVMGCAWQRLRQTLFNACEPCEKGGKNQSVKAALLC